MDRRTLFAKLLNRQWQESAMPMSPPTDAAGLTPYGGAWGFEQAAHLLRRSMFGPNLAQIQWSVEKGLNATVDKLFEKITLPEPPLNSYYSSDPNVPVGATWIRAPYNAATLVKEISYRELSLFGWTFNLILKEGMSIQEKLTLFWHNHFAINEIEDPKYLYRYITLLRSNAWGNFRQLTKDITIDPAMLRFLDGHRNTKSAPNENYARELLELFTIGKGKLVQEGDYTNYTEQDVKEIAKIMSGWKEDGFTMDNGGVIEVKFDPTRHDTSTKKLSHRFNNKEIPNMGDKEYAYVIDLIFQKKETARHICRRLYKWFVFYDITAETEANVIDPMAQILMENNFEIKPALQALLKSEHFYNKANVGAMIKHPIDLVMSVLKPMHVTISSELDKLYNSGYALYGACKLMQMKYYFVPQVAGWSAYYLGPGYYRNWVNASTLPLRMKFADAVASDGYSAFNGNGKKMVADVLGFVAKLEFPDDPNVVVESFTRALLPWALPQRELDILKGILLGGLPDYEWSVEYNAYAGNVTNSKLATAIANKLKALLRAIYSMAAFQLH
ncbi:MAG: DUF1800 family protein [Saprospiraceae bacterium]